MKEAPDSDLTGPWETIGLVRLDSVYARPEFGFGNPDDLDEDFDLRAYVKAFSAKGEPEPGPMRIDPYGPKQTDVPADLSSSLVTSSVTEPDPEWEVELLEEVPLEVYKHSDGPVIAARLAYLTGLVKSLYDLGHETQKQRSTSKTGLGHRSAHFRFPQGAVSL
jgi:hypothetical protein